MSLKVRSLFALLPMLLLGCASMSSQECQVSDWYAVGYTDGARGAPVNQFSDYQKDCAAHGVAPDFETYRSGRSEGLQEFCQPQRAFDLGSRGGHNPGVCPQELSGDFADAFQAGRHLYDLRSALYQVERQMGTKNKRLLDLQSHVHELEAHLVSREPTMEQRLQLLLELKNLAQEKQQLEDEMLELEAERDYHQQRLAAYEVSLYQSS